MLTTTKGEKMSDSIKSKRDKIAQAIGWTAHRVQGYEDGRLCQRGGYETPWRHEVDMDEYSKGFRTGYYAHACLLSMQSIRETLTAENNSGQNYSLDPNVA